MIPLRQILIEMGWPQPKLPVQSNNSTTVGVTNNIMISKMLKPMDMHLW